MVNLSQSFCLLPGTFLAWGCSKCSRWGNSEWLNHNNVCRTASATPGLLRDQQKSLHILSDQELRFWQEVPIAQSKGIVSFSETIEISIGPKAVRIYWPVLLDCWRSVELAEILIGIFTVEGMTALPDHLLILLAFSVAQQVQQWVVTWALRT